MIELSEPVVGYRWWTLRGDGALRRPFAVGTRHAVWERGVNVAVCAPVFDGAQPCGKTVPGPRCTCGLHAYARLSDRDFRFTCRIRQSREKDRVGTTSAGSVIVVGAVLLWGRMLSGGHCVRASHAEVLAVSGFHAAKAAKFYGVPHVGDEVLEAVATEHGAELSDAVVHQLLNECETAPRGGSSET